MNVLVYAGPGASKQGTDLLRTSLQSLLSPNYAVMLANPKMLRDEPWEEVTALLAFPGGRDLPYMQELGGAGNARIKHWVEAGGCYLGICAGAYYAAKSIEFDMGGSHAIVQDRELCFFDGICEGPIYPGFVYDSETGARNVPMQVSIPNGPSVSVHAYWNGGCLFRPSETSSGWTPLATYTDLPNKPIAAVLCSFGSGQALLCGFHPEYPLVASSSSAIPANSINLLQEFLRLLQLEVAADRVEPPAVTPHYMMASAEQDLRYFVEKLSSTFQVAINADMVDLKDTFRLAQADSASSSSAEIKVLIPSLQAPNTPLFDTQRFRSLLQSSALGRTFLYAQVVESTQSILDKNPRFLSALPDGFLATASFQTAGRGRGSNAWLSPAGSLPFSFVARFPVSLASKIVFVQYLFALAVVEALDKPEQTGRKLGICIKWPNDIYADLGHEVTDGVRYKKIGGILVNSSYAGKEFTLVVGCGINVANPKPTLSLDDLVSRYNSRYQANLPSCRPEDTLAKVLSTFEPMLEQLKSSGGFDPFIERYRRSWIHSNQVIEIEESGRRAEIDTITMDHGLLRARYVDAQGRYEGDLVDLQPDGNSFDMLKGLIKRKT